jgi:hypothetical protein
MKEGLRMTAGLVATTAPFAGHFAPGLPARVIGHCVF